MQKSKLLSHPTRVSMLWRTPSNGYQALPTLGYHGYSGYYYCLFILWTLIFPRIELNVSTSEEDFKFVSEPKSWECDYSRLWKTIDYVVTSYNVLASCILTVSARVLPPLIRNPTVVVLPDEHHRLIRFLYGIILPVVLTPYCLHPLT